MSVNYLLEWFVGGGLVLALLQLRGKPPEFANPWFRLLGTTLALFVIMLWAFPDHAGFIMFFWWASIFILPRYLFQRFTTMLQRGRFDDARIAARFISGVQPGYLWRTVDELVALAAQKPSGWQKQFATAPVRDPIVRLAVLTELSAVGEWDQIAFYLRDDYELYPDSWSYYVRALGELQAFDEMTYSLERMVEVSHRSKPDQNLFISFLFFFSFTGQRELVDRLFTGPLRALPEDTKQFWRGTAAQAAGDQFSANSLMIPLEDSSHRSISRAARQRRLEPIAEFPRLFSGGLEQRVARLNMAFHLLVEQLREERADRPVMTYSVIGVTLGAFFLQTYLALRFGPVFPLELAALVPELVLRSGEWWRLVGCLFLHGGLTHLFMNCVGLFILGPFVERTFRGWLFLLVYFGCGIGSSLFVVTLFSFGAIDTEILVGASGAVLGLVGVNGAALVWDYLQHRQEQTSRELRAIGLIVVLQVLFDLSTERVSFSAHLGGILSGILIATVLISMKNRASHRQ